MFGVGHSEGLPGPGRVGAELEERELGKHCLENRPDLWLDSGTAEVAHEEEIWLSEYGAAESENLQ